MTTPGGSTEMILVALALDHNPEIVTIAHSVRLMALNLSLPFMDICVSLLGKEDNWSLVVSHWSFVIRESNKFA